LKKNARKCWFLGFDGVEIDPLTAKTNDGRAVNYHWWNLIVGFWNILN